MSLISRFRDRAFSVLHYFSDSNSSLFLLSGIVATIALEILLRNNWLSKTMPSIGWGTGGLASVPQNLLGLSCLIVSLLILMKLLSSVSWINKSVYKICNISLILLLGFLVSSVVVVFDYSSELTVREKYRGFIGEGVKYDVLVTSQPSERHDTMLIEIARLQGLDFRLRVSVPRRPIRKIGEKCIVTGELKYPENFEDFDYISFLSSKRIYFEIDRPILKCYGRESTLKTFLTDTKLKIVNYFEHLLPEPQVSLLVGILFGEDRVFSEEFDQSLRNTGTTHIVAASGYNVTVLVLLVTKILVFLGRKWRVSVSIVAIWMFAIMSGLSASILRATIMGTISLISLLLGRKVNIGYLLLLSIYAFVSFNPRIIFDVGFQLSLAATMGLVYLSPLLLRSSEGLFKGGFREFVDQYLITTLSATVATLPISLYTFGVFSVVSPIVNMLVLPVLESTLLFGLLAGIVEGLSGIKAGIYVVWTQLKYFESIVQWFGSLDWAVYSTDSFSNLFLWLLYLFLALLVLLFSGGGSNYYLSRYEE